MARSGAIPARGEFALVVGARGQASVPRSGAEDAAALADARVEVDRLIAGGASRSEAARRVAAATGLPRRRLYASSADDRMSR